VSEQITYDDLVLALTACTKYRCEAEAEVERLSPAVLIVDSLRIEVKQLEAKLANLHKVNQVLKKYRDQVEVLEAWQRRSTSATIAFVNIAEVIANERGVVTVDEAVAALTLHYGKPQWASEHNELTEDERQAADLPSAELEGFPKEVRGE